MGKNLINKLKQLDGRESVSDWFERVIVKPEKEEKLKKKRKRIPKGHIFIKDGEP